MIYPLNSTCLAFPPFIKKWCIKRNNIRQRENIYGRSETDCELLGARKILSLHRAGRPGMWDTEQSVQSVKHKHSLSLSLEINWGKQETTLQLSL